MKLNLEKKNKQKKNSIWSDADIWYVSETPLPIVTTVTPHSP